jgi:hypothetical protein
MSRRFQLFVLFSFILSTATFAQRSVQSTVFDAKNSMPLEMVTVRLLKASDSTLVQGVQTNDKGWFSLNRINPGKYVLVVSSVGYLEYRMPVLMERRDLILKNIQLQENVLALKELEVRGTAAQLVVKGDTLEYNATAFKVAENAVAEDLLKRLPGVEITAEGKITVNGQEIKKIRVDGKKFFDGDIEMATKNLPAEMIDKIQVLEQKSDMALLTGFEDDETERIINFTTRPSRRSGIFGNASGGVGLDTENILRYDGNANVNIMKGQSQTSIVAGGNNINTTRSGRGRGGWGANTGITETQNLGVNNNTILNDKFKIGGDGSFNHSNNFNETQTTKENYLSQSVFNDSTYNRSYNDNYSANLRLEAEWKVDSLTTLIIQPNINYNIGFSDSYRDYVYLQGLDTTSYGTARNQGSNNSLSAGLRLIVNRRLPSKKGRSLTANVYSGFTQSASESFNFSNRISARPTTINQYTTNNTDRFNFDARVSFVEPLWDLRNMLEASVSFSTNTQRSFKDQYASSDLTAFFNKDVDAYTLYMEEYSNDFRNNFYRETIELNYRRNMPKYNLTLGFKGEPSQTYSRTTYGDGSTRNVDNEVFNFAPNGRFQYNFDKKEFLRIDYRGTTRQPSVNQLQPVKNNNNLMLETVGNPSLNASFNNNLRLMYSKFNDKTFSSFSTWISGNFTKDELVTNRIYDSSGKQYTQTVNTSEIPVSFNGNVMFNTPIIQKRLHFNTSTNLGYNTNYGYTSKGVNIDLIDIENLALGDLSFTRRYTAQEQLSLTFTHDVVEVGARGNLRYSNSLNNLSEKLTETYDWTISGNVVLRLPYDITLNSNINYSNRLGYSSFDLSEVMWNASVDKSLFKNRGVLSLRWNDILRQQLNIRQSVGDNSITVSRYNTLTSYFLVNFSYRIRQFGAGSGGRDGGSMRGPERFGPGMRMPGSGEGRMRMSDDF